ncbi:MAG: hypothetical protein SFX18_11375 [Pirellulales bacterium]|nr:hypothetical protein [Pirellulales bacterium]
MASFWQAFISIIASAAVATAARRLTNCECGLCVIVVKAGF